jgi:Flp pilus assembly protein TadG
VASVTARSRDERGSAAVEFALVLPLLLMLVFGIIDFGRMYNAKITLNEAAREGARSAALQTAASGISRAASLTADIGPTTQAITDCTDDAAVQAEATIQYNFKFVTPLGFMAGIFSGGGGVVQLQSKGVMPCLH